MFTAATHLFNYFLKAAPEEVTATTIFCLQFGQSVVGIFMAPRVHKQLTSRAILTAFVSHVEQLRPAGSVVMQYCGEGISGGVTFGVVSNSDGGAQGLAAVQSTMQEWHRGRCLTGYSGNMTLEMSLWSYEPQLDAVGRLGMNRTSNSTFNNSTFSGRSRARRSGALQPPPPLTARAVAACTEIRVEPDNDCYKLADRCGLPVSTASTVTTAASNATNLSRDRGSAVRRVA